MSEVSKNIIKLWHVPRWCPLSFLRWPLEGEIVVLQRASGDIHLVSQVVAAILELLQEQGLSSAAILEHIKSGCTEPFHITTDEELDRYILKPLQHLGLIETQVGTFQDLQEPNT